MASDTVARHSVPVRPNPTNAAVLGLMAAGRALFHCGLSFGVHCGLILRVRLSS